MKICNICDVIFKDDIFTFYGSCPLRGCSGSLIEIDENLYEAYKGLNEKGYITIYCCSAHSFGGYTSTYISFHGKYSFPVLPVGFKVEKKYIKDMSEEKDICITTISKMHDRKLSNYNLQMQIWKTARDVLIWVEKLKCIEDDEE